MEPEGTVHALEETGRLIRNSGTLIEIHPVRKPPTIEVRSNGETVFAEPDPGYDYDSDVRRAEDAVAVVLRRGLFVRVAEVDFDFVTYGATSKELRDFFAVAGAYDPTPKEAALTARRDLVYGRVDEQLAIAGVGATVAYKERGHMSRLMPSA